MFVGDIGRADGFAPIFFELVELHLDDHDAQRRTLFADATGYIEAGAIADCAEREMFGRPRLHRPAEVVTEGIVVSDEAQRLAPVARSNRYAVLAGDIKHRGTGAGHEGFQFAVKRDDGVVLATRERIAHLLIFRQEKRQGAWPFEHRAQQRDLQIGIGVALALQCLDRGHTTVEACAVEGSRNDGCAEHHKDHPDTTGTSSELFRR